MSPRKKQKFVVTRFILTKEAFKKSSYSVGLVNLAVPEIDAILAEFECKFLYPVVLSHYQPQIDAENSPLKRAYLAFFGCSPEKKGVLLQALIDTSLVEAFLLEPRDYSDRHMRKLMRKSAKEMYVG